MPYESVPASAATKRSDISVFCHSPTSGRTPLQFSYRPVIIEDPQALILPVTGASRHTLQTFQSIMSTKKTESHPQMRSKGPILTTSRTCLTFISQILPVSQAFFPARLSMMQMLNLVLERLCSIRMEPGLMITSKITK